MHQSSETQHKISRNSPGPCADFSLVCHKHEVKQLPRVIGRGSMFCRRSLSMLRADSV